MGRKNIHAWLTGSKRGSFHRLPGGGTVSGAPRRGSLSLVTTQRMSDRRMRSVGDDVSVLVVAGWTVGTRLCM